MTDRMCRNCRFYDIDGVKNKNGHIMKNRVALCTWADRAWPESIQRPPRKEFMPPYLGQTCATFEPAHDGRKMGKI